MCFSVWSKKWRKIISLILALDMAEMIWEFASSKHEKYNLCYGVMYEQQQQQPPQKKIFFFFKSAILSRLRRRTHMHTHKKKTIVCFGTVCVCVYANSNASACRWLRDIIDSPIRASNLMYEHFRNIVFFFARFYHINAKFIPILMLLLCNLRQHNDSVKRAFHRIQIQCSRPKTSRKMISVFFFFWVDGENLPAMSNETCTITEFLHIKKRRRYNTHWRYYIYIEYKHLMAG